MIHNIQTYLWVPNQDIICKKEKKVKYKTHKTRKNIQIFLIESYKNLILQWKPKVNDRQKNKIYTLICYKL